MSGFEILSVIIRSYTETITVNIARTVTLREAARSPSYC